jgi:uncharacterized membrane protein
MKRWLAVSTLAAVVLLPATPAVAKSFTLPEADVRIDVQQDGALVVTEQITFDFDGDFSGAYRDIPLGGGVTIADVSVAEGEQRYGPGACAELGCSSPPGSFGTRDLGDTLRIVWHYSALNERRTFTVRYLVTGQTKVYDDVAEVNWKVWGDEWSTDLETLEAGLTIPGSVGSGDVRVWGHPAAVRGEVDLGPDSASQAISRNQRVESPVLIQLTSVVGSRMMLEAKMGGITPAIFSFKGKWEDWPP